MLVRVMFDGIPVFLRQQVSLGLKKAFTIRFATRAGLSPHTHDLQAHAAHWPQRRPGRNALWFR